MKQTGIIDITAADDNNEKFLINVPAQQGMIAEGEAAWSDSEGGLFTQAFMSVYQGLASQQRRREMLPGIAFSWK